MRMMVSNLSKSTTTALRSWPGSSTSTGLVSKKD